MTPTTYAEALAQGYTAADVMYSQGYISRKTKPEDAEVRIAGGNRKGQLYVALPAYNTTRYYLRQYLKKGA